MLLVQQWDPLEIVKLKQLVEQGLLEYVLPGGSKLALPIVVLRKVNRDI